MHAMHKLYGVVDGVSQFRLVIKVIMVIVTSLLRSYKVHGCHKVVWTSNLVATKLESCNNLATRL